MPSLAPALRRGLDAALEATVVLSFSRVGYEVRRRVEHWTPLADLDGRGRTVVVTGATSGLGLAAARALVASGAHVIAVARDEARGERAVAELRAAAGAAGRGGNADLERADLADLAQVRALAQRLATRADVDTLVHNAGAMFDDRDLTVDGLERTYQVHVAAPFLLTGLLLDTLEASAPARVVTVTSGGMYAERLDADRVDSPDRYRPTLAYARAKRAQVALTAEWARRSGHLGIRFEVVHPGWADTPGVASSLPGFRRVTAPILRDAAEGADSIAWLVLADLDDAGGHLWHDRRRRGAHHLPWTRTPPTEGVRLWDRLVRDTGLDPADPDAPV